MLDAATRTILLAAVLTGASCTYQYREGRVFKPERVVVLTETIERHNVELKQAGEPTLWGWYLTPKAPRRHLVYFYGSNRNVAGEYSKLHWLAQTHDLDILVVDFPGYGFSDGSPSVEGLARASLRIFDAMAARWPRPGGPIFVYGHSMGTAFAVHVGVNRPGTAIILEAPFTSIQDQIAALKRRLPWYARLFLRIWIDDALTRWRQPVELIKELAAPLLIIHGSDDQTVPVELGRRMFAEALTTRKHLCELPGEDHSPVRPNPDRRTDLGCLTAFLGGHDAPATTPAR
jgi:pimeloyl-ACP methyl ester carboxylesterase